MKRTNTCFAVALSAALAMGMMAGCGNQSASPESAPAESAAESAAESTEATTDTASADAEQSQDEIIAELKAAIANPFAYKSVTINETVNPLTKGEEEAAGDEAVSSKGVYKFDASGDKLRTSMEATVSDVR